MWLLIALFVLIPTAGFAMTSTNYQILWDSVNSGGTDVSTSTNYTIRDTIGEHATGFSESENYRISAGYRVGDTQLPFIALNLGTQENTTQVAWTAFSNAAKTVTVSSAASYSVGEYVGVVENEGFSQLIAVGKITDITGTTITVDDWEGEPASLSSTPSGSDDYVYRMRGSAAELSTIIPGLERTSMTVTDVVINADSGYTMSIQGANDLLSGSTRITAVSDGTISLNDEEYGTEIVGTLSVGGGSDLSIPTSTQRTIQSSSTYGDNDRVGVIYKLSVSPQTPSGSYTQTVIYRLTGSF